MPHEQFIDTKSAGNFQGKGIKILGKNTRSTVFNENLSL